MDLLEREAKKIRRNWKLYFCMVLLFFFAPVAIEFLYNSYYPFKVSEAHIQPFPVVEEVTEPGGTITYLVDVDKYHQFRGTVERYLQSDKCHIFEPINPPYDSNRPIGRVQDSTTIVIPLNTKPCPYRLVIQTVYHPTFLRSLDPIVYTTDEFLVTERKEEVADLKNKVDNLHDDLEQQVIDETKPTD